MGSGGTSTSASGKAKDYDKVLKRLAAQRPEKTKKRWDKAKQ